MLCKTFLQRLVYDPIRFSDVTAVILLVLQGLAMGFHKFTFVARGTDTQLGLSCVAAPLATNVNLFACFAECLFKSSFSYVASDSLYGWACRVYGQYTVQHVVCDVWSIDRTAKTMPSWHCIRSNVPRCFIDCKCTLM